MSEEKSDGGDGCLGCGMCFVVLPMLLFVLVVGMATICQSVWMYFHR